MPAFPIQSTTGDPIFRAQHNSIDAIRRFSRVAADATQRLNNQERLITPGDDAVSFSTSRRARSEIGALKIVQETGQVNVTGLTLANEALSNIKGQLDMIKRQLIQAQVAGTGDRDSIQAEIDLALRQIDSTARNTKLGSRSLLDGTSTIGAGGTISVNAAGVLSITPMSVNQGFSLQSLQSGVKGVKVNKIGVGGPVKFVGGKAILSLNISVVTTAAKPWLSITAAGAGEFMDLRVTGKLGATTVRLTDADVGAGAAQAFNRLSQETGVLLISDANGVYFSTAGAGADEFIKVEVLAQSIGVPNTGLVTNANGDTVGNAGANGASLTAFGSAAVARINGFDIELGGANGNTARFLERGFDIEFDFNTSGLSAFTALTGTRETTTINVDLTQGVIGLLGTSGTSADVVHYSFGNMTSAMLGRGNAMYSVNTISGILADDTAIASAAVNLGAEIIDGGSVADLGAGGELSLSSGNFMAALRTVDRAINQVINEQTRLGTVQGNFIDAVSRAEVGIGNLTAADADIIGVDAATEITNLVQSQLAVSTASSLLSQANGIQGNIFSLLRG